MRFPINHFSIIVRLPPCTALFVTSYADITYFISGSVAVDRRYNAASIKEIKTEGMFLHFLIKYFLKKTPSPLAHNTVEQQTHQRWINVETMLIVNVHQRCFNVDFGWKWKLSRHKFIDVVLTLTKKRWNNVDRITSIQRPWLNVVSTLILGWKGKLSQRMFIGVEKTALKQLCQYLLYWGSLESGSIIKQN